MWRCQRTWTSGTSLFVIQPTSTPDWKLLSRKLDDAEQAVRIIRRPGREEQLVDRTVSRRAAAEFQAPNLLDLQRLAAGIAECPKEFSRGRVESIDYAAG